MKFRTSVSFSQTVATEDAERAVSKIEAPEEVNSIVEIVKEIVSNFYIKEEQKWQTR